MQTSTAIGTRENIKIIDTIENNGIKVEVLEYQNLLGSTNTYGASNLYFMKQANIRARQIAVYLNNKGIKIEPGAMSYFKGNIDMVSGLTVGNAVGKFFSGMVTGEHAAQPEYKGTGMVVLEPTFKHYILTQLDQGEQAIVDKGMFYCAESSVTVKPIMNSTISSALLGGEGIFQMALTGPGVVVLESPVPMCEIDIMEINNESLKVDGNFALLRTGNIRFTVERSARTLVGSAMSGEGLVNVFTGTGSVWLAPTLKVYGAINMSRTYGGELSSVNMNTSNGRAK